MDKNAEKLKEYLRMIARLMSAQDENEKSCCGVTMAQCRALVAIGEAGAISINELAQETNLDKSTISRTVDGLVAQGYCIREIAPEDRRYVAVRLSDGGIKTYDALSRGMDECFESIYNALPEDRRGQVIESALLIIEAVKKTCCCGEDNCND